MRKHLSSLIKIGVTVAGLGYIVWTVPLAQIGSQLTGLIWQWALISFALVAASLFLRAYRWMLLLRGLDASIPFGRLVELYFVGSFFNTFLPSGFGGDAVRVLEAAQDVPADISAGTVIVDRMTGLLMLFAMALLALPFRPTYFPKELAWIIAAICAAGLAVGFFVLEGSTIRRFGAWLPAQLSPTGDGPLARVLRAVQGCGWRAVLGALAVSALFSLLLVGWWDAAGRALGYDVPYGYYLLVVPILSVALLVPSISGLGVREYLAPLLFAGAGLDPAQAVALSLLVFVIMRLTSLLGAPVYIISTLRRDRSKSAEPG